MTPEQIIAARGEVSAVMFDSNGNGPWLEIAYAALRKFHTADQALIIGHALGALAERPGTYPAAITAAWTHLLDRFNKRLEGVHGFAHPGTDPVPRPPSVVPGGGGFRRRSRHR